MDKSKNNQISDDKLIIEFQTKIAAKSQEMIFETPQKAIQLIIQYSNEIANSLNLKIDEYNFRWKPDLNIFETFIGINNKAIHIIFSLPDTTVSIN